MSHYVLLQQELAAARERERWIPVSERLPRTGELCWVIYSGHVQNVAYRREGLGYACADGYEWRPDDSLESDPILDGEVSHWRELPSLVIYEE